MKKGKVVSGKKYAVDKEEYDMKKANKANKMVGKPADIASSLAKSKKEMGYSDKPRIKPQKKGK